MRRSARGHGWEGVSCSTRPAPRRPTPDWSRCAGRRCSRASSGPARSPPPGRWSRSAPEGARGTLARRAFALDRAGPGPAGAPPPCSRPGGLRHADGPHVGGPAQGAAGPADPRRRGRSGGGAPTEPPRRDRRHRRAGAEWHLVHRVRRARPASDPSTRSSRHGHPTSIRTVSSVRPTRCTSRPRPTVRHSSPRWWSVW